MMGKRVYLCDRGTMTEGAESGGRNELGKAKKTYTDAIVHRNLSLDAQDSPYKQSNSKLHRLETRAMVENLENKISNLAKYQEDIYNMLRDNMKQTVAIQQQNVFIIKTLTNQQRYIETLGKRLDGKAVPDDIEASKKEPEYDDNCPDCRVEKNLKSCLISLQNTRLDVRGLDECTPAHPKVNDKTKAPNCSHPILEDGGRSLDGLTSQPPRHVSCTTSSSLHRNTTFSETPRNTTFNDTARNTNFSDTTRNTNFSDNPRNTNFTDTTRNTNFSDTTRNTNFPDCKGHDNAETSGGGGTSKLSSNINCKQKGGTEKRNQADPDRTRPGTLTRDGASFSTNQESKSLPRECTRTKKSSDREEPIFV